MKVLGNQWARTLLLLAGLGLVITVTLVVVMRKPEQKLPQGWNSCCAKNMRNLHLGLSFIMDGGYGLRERFLEGIAERESPVGLIAQYADLPHKFLVCPCHEGGDQLSKLSGEALSKVFGDDDICYETWPWNNQIWEAVNKEATCPLIWEKASVHAGKRFVVYSYGGLELVTEADFEEQMRSARARRLRTN